MEKYQSKSITPVDDYVFTLSDELRTIAREELRETDEVRENALRAIREWAIQNPRIVSLRLDAKFILRFLRFKKFSIPMAQEAIERYLLLRKYFFEGQYIYQNFDYKLPALFALLEKGMGFALPERDHLNRRVIFYRPKCFHPTKNINHDIIRFNGVIFETLLENEEDQIRGCVHVVDSSGLGLNYITVLTPQQCYRLAKNIEKMVPMRHKAFHANHINPAMKFVLDFALSLMSEKLRNRVHFHSKLEDQESFDKNLLPAEYGGTIPMAEMIRLWVKELDEHRQTLLSHDKMTVKFDLYPPSVRNGSVRSLRIPLDSTDEAFEVKKDMFGINGIQGSFRKLEID